MWLEVVSVLLLVHRTYSACQGTDSDSCQGHYSCRVDTPLCSPGWSGPLCTFKTWTDKCISNPTVCHTIDIMFLLDNSGNILSPNAGSIPSNFAYGVNFINNIAAALGIDCNRTQAGAILNGNNGQVKIKLNEFCTTNYFQNAVNTRLIFQNQRHNLADGLAKAVQSFNEINGGRTNSWKVVVIIYGGEISSPTNPQNGTEQAAALKAVADEIFVFNTDFFYAAGLATPDLALQMASTPHSTHLYTLKAPDYSFQQFTDNYIQVVADQITASCLKQRLDITSYSGSVYKKTWSGNYTCKSNMYNIQLSLLNSVNNSISKTTNFTGVLFIWTSATEAARFVTAILVNDVLTVNAEDFVGFGATELSPFTMTATYSSSMSAIKVLTVGRNCTGTYLYAVPAGFCMNGGTCQPSGVPNTLTCCCPPNFTGKQCQTQLMPCNPNPCIGGVACTVVNGVDYRCHCPTGLYGKNCGQNLAANKS